MRPGEELVGIGVDSVSWGRIERFLNDHSPVVERLLSPSEKKSFHTASDPLPLFARFFVAKEAYFKACNGFWLGPEAGFREIEISFEDASRFRVACDFQAEGEFFKTPNGIGARVVIWKEPS